MSTDTPPSILLGMLPIHCDRRNKVVNVHLPVDDMKAYINNLEARKAAATMLLDTLRSAPAGTVPDLVVYFKGEAFALATIPDDAKQDVAIRRALNSALGGDIGDRTFFDVPPASPRAPQKAGEEHTDPPADAVGGEDKTTARKGKKS